MGREITLSEFKEFCKGKNEVRYAPGWNHGSTDSVCEGSVEFNKIAISEGERAIRMSAKYGSIRLNGVVNIEIATLIFGDTEVRVTCYDRKRHRTTVTYIFFAPQ